MTGSRQQSAEPSARSTCCVVFLSIYWKGRVGLASVYTAIMQVECGTVYTHGARFCDHWRLRSRNSFNSELQGFTRHLVVFSVCDPQFYDAFSGACI